MGIFWTLQYWYLEQWCEKYYFNAHHIDNDIKPAETVWNCAGYNCEYYAQRINWAMLLHRLLLICRLHWLHLRCDSFRIGTMRQVYQVVLNTTVLLSNLKITQVFTDNSNVINQFQRETAPLSLLYLKISKQYVYRLGVPTSNYSRK